MTSTKSPRTPRRNPAPASPDPQAVAERAYFLWLDDRAGNPDPLTNWLKAEAELAAEAPKPKARARRTAK